MSRNKFGEVSDHLSQPILSSFPGTPPNDPAHLMRLRKPKGNTFVRLRMNWKQGGGGMGVLG